MNSSNIESRENIHFLYAEKQNLSQKVIIMYLIYLSQYQSVYNDTFYELHVVLFGIVI